MPSSDGVRIVSFGDPDYPTALKSVPQPPERLWIRGTLPDARTPAVGVVGARASDSYGDELAAQIAGGLARAGVVVVSGGARGIDGIAHRAALQAGGRTVVVFGCGIDVVYPSEHRELFEAVVAKGGALVSEQEPGTGPLRGCFPARNRIIAGLSLGVVVVRAEVKSGSLVTARFAREMDRPVMTVPGDVRDALSAGAMELFGKGARAVRDAGDILRVCGIEGKAGDVHVDVHGYEERPGPQLEGDCARLFAALDHRAPKQFDELVETLAVPAPALARLLTTLELQGLCVQQPGKYFLRV